MILLKQVFTQTAEASCRHMYFCQSKCRPCGHEAGVKPCSDTVMIHFCTKAITPDTNITSKWSVVLLVRAKFCFFCTALLYLR